MMKKPRRINISPEEVDALCKRVEERSLREEDVEIIKAIAENTVTLCKLVKENKIPSKRQLRKLLGIGAKRTQK
jgi:nitrogen regulatory protein PII-like uncharacterized protein